MLTEGIIYLTNKKETRLCVQYMFTIPVLGQGRTSVNVKPVWTLQQDLIQRQNKVPNKQNTRDNDVKTEINLKIKL